MASFHRLTIFAVGGTGQITQVPWNDLGVFGAGASVDIGIVLDSGFTLNGWYIGNK